MPETDLRRVSVSTTRTPSTAINFFPASRERASYVDPLAGVVLEVGVEDRSDVTRRVVKPVRIAAPLAQLRS